MMFWAKVKVTAAVVVAAMAVSTAVPATLAAVKAPAFAKTTAGMAEEAKKPQAVAPVGGSEPAAVPKEPQSKTYVSWADALAAVTWGEWVGIPMDPKRMLPGGPRAKREGNETMAIFGRLFLNRLDRGSLAVGQRYEELVRFEPAAEAAVLRAPAAGLVLKEDMKKEVLDELRKGDLPAIVRGTFSQTRIDSHDGLNSTTLTELHVVKCDWLDLKQAAERAAQLLPEAAAREAYLKRLKPVEVGALRVFIDHLVVHPDLRTQFRSQILLSFRAFNGSAEKVELPPPVVRMRLGERWLKTGLTFGKSRTVPAGGWSDRDAPGSEFCFYKPESPAAAGQEAELEISFSVGGQEAVYREKVNAMGVGRGGP